MMTVPEDYVKELPLEEQLIAAVVTGSVEEHEGLLSGQLGDVDAMIEGRRTLLHYAVRYGKMDWVERLIAMGADPGICDEEGSNVVRVAEDMWSAHPEESGRGDIFKMVRLVHYWNTSRGGGGGGSADSNSAVNVLRRQVARAAEERARSGCVDAMMRATTILNMDEARFRRVRGFYHRIHSTSPFTSCMLEFLRSQPGVRIEVDCDSSNIGRMKESFRDHDGVVREGRKYHYFVDFEESVVYLGGKLEENMKEEDIAARLALALCQMVVGLVFKNGGRPYAKGDAVNERRLKMIVKDAVERKGPLYKKSQKLKEIYMMTAVPWVITKCGLTTGTFALLIRLPALFDYYEKHVMPAIQNMS